ncbi:MAG: prolyl-tRNA synthetase associated domain-containing protein [Lachnospiraceae bacterium]
MILDIEKPVYEVLDRMNIPYMRVEHEATASCEAADEVMGDLTGTPSKSLFLTNKKKTEFWLILMNGNKPLNIKEFSPLVGEKHLSFAPEEKMVEKLGLTPGNVSVFGLINNTEHDVHVVADTELRQREKITFHPNINTRTIEIPTEDMYRFIKEMGNPFEEITLP